MLVQLYHEKKQPVYKRCREIISGSVDATKAEIGAGDEWETDAEIAEAIESADNVKGIPEFWFTVLSSCPLMDDLIHEWDEDVLKHLLDVR